MKKILALVCFLIAVAACATQPSGNKDTMSNANVKASAVRKSFFMVLRPFSR